MDTPDPDQQISVSSRSGSGSSRDRKWNSPRLDAADTAAPSTDSASDSKRVHAGGQTMLSSCKDVKPPDGREGKKDPSQFIAPGSEGQRLPSSKLNPSTPSTYAREDFALRCNGSSIRYGREFFCCSPDSSPLSVRQAEIIEQPYGSGSGAEDWVSVINGRGDNSPANTARECGHGTHARDSEVVNVFALPSACAPPDKLGVGDVNMPSHPFDFHSSVAEDSPINYWVETPKDGRDPRLAKSLILRVGKSDT
ncbi:hypothetical protein K523DRAFT_358447 [Schizophyllum commune Tattone D]|nr:hypothetical protein K523DRAFT_358447 [Schizophyllum commune Tattone D]